MGIFQFSGNKAVSKAKLEKQKETVEKTPEPQHTVEYRAIPGSDIRFKKWIIGCIG